MGERSRIEWTDATWNPWIGCDRVSPGCAHCYAGDVVERYGGEFYGNVHRTKDHTFGMPYRLKEPQKVFTCSFSDFFHPAADPWRPAAWEIIRETQHLTYQILTKRVEDMRTRLPIDWPYANVWLGVSIENQRYVFRSDGLRDIPATVRFLSLEPLIGPVDLTLDGIQWVIVGGESGPKRRPMEGWWVRAVRDRCAERGVPFFFKQWGGPSSSKRGGDKASLDGERHRAFPEIAA